MTWIQFFMWMTIIYLIYFGLNILIDGTKSGNRGSEITSDNHLTFSEHTKPQMLDEDIDDDQGHDYNDEVEFAGSLDGDSESVFGAENSITPTGGVLLKDLFSLARAEAIEFTRQVIY